MREVDEEHSPKEFVKHFSAHVNPTGVAVVIDISHETPVYHPEGLQDAGVEYIKFPTVSKEKPKPEEVDEFIKIIDKIRADGCSRIDNNVPGRGCAIKVFRDVNGNGRTAASAAGACEG